MNKRKAIYFGAWAIRHALTTVPLFIGFLVVIGAAGSYDLERISTTLFLIYAVAGLTLAGIGTAFMNYFER